MKFLKKKNTMNKICIVVIMVLIFTTSIEINYAAKNIHAEEPTLLADFLGFIIGKVGTGVLGVAIAPLVSVFGLLLFLILYLLFCGAGLGGFPFPDEIVFNKIALFDPNFLNPDKDSIGGLVSTENGILNVSNGLFAKMYSSFFVLAVTIFTIAALIIGIKLVFSSLAAEKAKYKEALNNWIMGIVMLFLVHYLLAGMFYLNEKIVEEVSVLADGIEVKIDVLESFPLLGSTVGKAASGLVNSVAKFLGAKDSVTAITLHGYGGIVMRFFCLGILGSDLISSITFLIIMGQTFGLVISYLKRTFMCIVLGVMAPLVVAVDVIQKALK